MSEGRACDEAAVKIASLQLIILPELCNSGYVFESREEAFIYAEANLADARRKRNWNEYNQVLRDRRIDVYDEMLGAKVNRSWY